MKITLLSLFFMISFSTVAQTHCDNFKTGRFKYTTEGMENITVIRTATTQTEIDNNTGAEVSGPIEWVSDCEFIMICKKVTMKELDHMLNKKIVTKITKSDNEKYTCLSTFEGMEFEIKMIKITDQ